jgi:hypothetical protein
MKALISWPPPHKIRHSKRAKRISLRITATQGLEVVVPIRKKIETGLAFLNLHRAWVEEQTKKMKWLFNPDIHDEKALPEKIELKSIDQTVDIVYRTIESTACVSCRVESNRIIFYGAITDFSTCSPFMIDWLKKQAKIHLKKLLMACSAQCDLPFEKLSVRAQKTRWGSCNSNRDIQLNYKLLFLPARLVHYILVHELCHTKHLNHSKRFWALVEKWVPDYRDCVRELKDADQWIPRWLR